MCWAEASVKPSKLVRDAHGLKSLLKYHASSWVLMQMEHLEFCRVVWGNKQHCVIPNPLFEKLEYGMWIDEYSWGSELWCWMCLLKHINHNSKNHSDVKCWCLFFAGIHPPRFPWWLSKWNRWTHVCMFWHGLSFFILVWWCLHM